MTEPQQNAVEVARKKIRVWAAALFLEGLSLSVRIFFFFLLFCLLVFSIILLLLLAQVHPSAPRNSRAPEAVSSTGSAGSSPSTTALLQQESPSPHDTRVYALYNAMCGLKYKAHDDWELKDTPAWNGAIAINPPDRAPLEVTWKISIDGLSPFIRLWIWDDTSAPAQSQWNITIDEWTRCAFPSLSKELSLPVADLIDDLFRLTLADCTSQGISRERLSEEITCNTRKFTPVEQGIFGFIYRLSISQKIHDYTVSVSLSWLQDYINSHDETDNRTHFRTIIELELEPR